MKDLLIKLGQLRDQFADQIDHLNALWPHPDGKYAVYPCFNGGTAVAVVTNDTHVNRLSEEFGVEEIDRISAWLSGYLAGVPVGVRMERERITTPTIT